MKKKAALAACSDPISPGRLHEISKVTEILQDEGLQVIVPAELFGGKAPDPGQKARCLMDCFADPEVGYIFDVSGGDLANQVLPLLDYDIIQRSGATFFGYSDLTTVINAIIGKTGRSAVNYQIRHLLYDYADEQRACLREKILPGKIDVRDLDIRFIRGDKMQGKLLGGNIRCFLKLAGTPFWPDLEGSILLLESMGGGVNQMVTALEQYRQLGVFSKVRGILLGTFSKMEKEDLHPTMEELVLAMVPEDIPVACTRFVGHYADARAVVLGREVSLGLPGTGR